MQTERVKIKHVNDNDCHVLNVTFLKQSSNYLTYFTGKYINGISTLRNIFYLCIKQNSGITETHLNTLNKEIG